MDYPFGLPPEEYLYRCPVCGKEMLGKEAIMDVAVGGGSVRDTRIPNRPLSGSVIMGIEAKLTENSINTILQTVLTEG